MTTRTSGPGGSRVPVDGRCRYSLHGESSGLLGRTTTCLGIPGYWKCRNNGYSAGWAITGISNDVRQTSTESNCGGRGREAAGHSRSSVQVVLADGTGETLHGQLCAPGWRKPFLSSTSFLGGAS
jgi:hypothetical protein